MAGDRVDEICDRCKKEISIPVKDFERAMKNEEPVLCPDCYSKYLDEQTEEMPKRCFEYKTISIHERFLREDGLNKLGPEGWELITVDSGWAYLKRECYKEQKAAYEDARESTFI